jgi:hypothetical protein
VVETVPNNATLAAASCLVGLVIIKEIIVVIVMISFDDVNND